MAAEAGLAALPRSPERVLHEVFGYPAFRGLQAEIVQHVLAGGDCLVLMPTGGGKSLCFQVPALCLDGLTIVVSPLIALMQDQVETLRQLGVRAAALNSAQPPEARRETFRAMREGSLDLLYLAPERLTSEGFLDVLAAARPALFAIDEAHCVSQWGFDFRPDYLSVNLLHERFPGVPRIALTATADGPTRLDIIERLQLQQGRVFVAGFDRPNIRYQIALKDNPRRQLLEMIRSDHQGDAAIVYCMSRAKVDATAQWLVQQGVSALPYHAGMAPELRSRHQERFLKESGIVMVATIAFGMGIDKPDVRLVAHLDMPKSLEAYYQETGRAGRDGLPAMAWLAYGIEDVAKLKMMLANGEGDARRKQIERQKLDAMLGYVETTSCRRQVLLAYFGDQLPAPCGNCDTCLSPPTSHDGTEIAQKLLSTIYRTGQRFGAGHIMDVLAGTASERASSFGHDKLSVFGIGRGTDAKMWRSALRQLVAMDLVQVDVEGHGGLSLGPDVRDVLRGQRRVMLRQDPAPREARRAYAGKAAAPVVGSGARPLFDGLRAWRLDEAKRQGVPPYVIFHDATLVAIAEERPRSIGALASMPGMGAVKLARYGQDILTVIAAS